jgi:hypothetical protein
MNYQVQPHHIAIRAMLVALVLPVVLFMFLAIRTRQLQSTANPRWSQFAKVTGPSAVAIPELVKPIEIPTADHTMTTTELNGTVEVTDKVEITTADSTSRIVTETQSKPSLGSLKTELDEIRQRLDLLANLETVHRSEDTQRGIQFVNLLNAIREMISSLTALNQERAPDKPSDETVMNSPPEMIPDDITGTWVQFATETVQDVDLRKFLNQFSEFAQVSVLSGSETPLPTEKPARIPMTLKRAHLDKTLNEPKYVLRREGHVSLICTTDEAIHLKPEHLNRILRANLPRDAHGADLQQMLPLIVKGLVNTSDWRPGIELSEGLATDYRDAKISISRRALARAFYECAAVSWQQSEHYKARQQIEASLRQNKDDVDAIRLRNEINQDSSLNLDR